MNSDHQVGRFNMQSRPFHGLEFQPSELCPKNYIIFDQTDNRSQIVFNPAIAPKLRHPDIVEEQNEQHEEKETGTWKEDSDDIDALLSFEEGEEEEIDEEEVSTARTYGDYESDSDTGSTYGSKPRKSRLASIEKASCSGSSRNREKKKSRKMRKMVEALRGIVPSGDEMNTVAVLDEAVKYLKSLKVDVQNLGVGNLKN